MIRPRSWRSDTSLVKVRLHRAQIEPAKAAGAEINHDRRCLEERLFNWKRKCELITASGTGGMGICPRETEVNMCIEI